MSFPFSEVEEKIGYVFANKTLLKTAFTHSSYVNGTNETSNERLEFLGDAVLELAVSETLYADEQKLNEGKMTELRQKLVSKTALAKAVRELGIERYLLKSGGEDNVGEKTVSSLFETVVAAIYLDGGMDNARKFVTKNLQVSNERNYISELQEYLQKRGEELPEYKELGKIGPDNAPEFRFAVTALGKSAEGVGKKKSDAKQQAAKSLLEKLQVI